MTETIDVALTQVAVAITAADEVALACHVHPDGDALGSLLAFHLLCRANGVASVASWGEPFAVAPHYRFLPGLDLAVLGWDLDYDVALDLYVGLLTGTGRFQYPNTTTGVFALAQELAGHGLPLGVITRELFEKHRFAYLRLAATALARAELDTEHRLVAAWVTAEDLSHYGVEFDETEGFIDLVRRTAEADVSCVLKEAPEEGLRVSLRSVTGVDVGKVAGELGGGGHHFMAGFISDRSIPETIACITALLAGSKSLAARPGLPERR